MFLAKICAVATLPGTAFMFKSRLKAPVAHRISENTTQLPMFTCSCYVFTILVSSWAISNLDRIKRKIKTSKYVDVACVYIKLHFQSSKCSFNFVTVWKMPSALSWAKNSPFHCRWWCDVKWCDGAPSLVSLCGFSKKSKQLTCLKTDNMALSFSSGEMSSTHLEQKHEHVDSTLWDASFSLPSVTGKQSTINLV